MTPQHMVVGAYILVDKDVILFWSWLYVPNVLSFLSRSFLRLRLREAKGFPKPKEKPGQDPYDGN